MDTRTKLVESTRQLLWERGYAATSPRAVLDEAGVGQGSMYHHFRGKEALAVAAIEVNADEMRTQVLAELQGPGTALERISRYLRRERDALRGCRFGRLVQDPEVVKSPALHLHVGEMFSWLRDQLTEVIRDGQRHGDVPAGLSAEHTAAAIAATLQGGYVLARAADDQRSFDDAISGVLDLLSCVSTAA